MKKKLFAGLATGLMVLSSVGMASAANIAATYTGDNIVLGWYHEVGGAGTIDLDSGDNYENWKLADSNTLILKDGHNYQLVWEVTNSGGKATNNPTAVNPTGTNPAAFLGQITGDVVGGLTYSGAANWKVSGDRGQTWTTATSYGTNSGTNIWSQNNNNGPVQGIANNAEWIWTSNSPRSLSTYIQADFQTTSPAATPIPASALLFGCSLLGMLGIGSRKKKA